jgi:hypothetical protein
MSNLIGQTTRAIPYNGFLRQITKSVPSTILFQQLEYWFFKTDNEKFYKYLEPCETPTYKEGDSWVEELAFSKDEFRTAFDNIGIRYVSKKEFDKAEDKFAGLFYCSYTDRITGLTWYYRNNKLVEETLRELGKTIPRRSVEKPDTRKSGNPIPVDGLFQRTKDGKPNTDIYQEITQESTTIDYTEEEEAYQTDNEKEVISELRKIIEKNSSSPNTNYLSKNRSKLRTLLTKHSKQELLAAVYKLIDSPNFHQWSIGGILQYVTDFLYSKKPKQDCVVNKLFTEHKLGQFDGTANTILGN